MARSCERFKELHLPMVDINRTRAVKLPTTGTGHGPLGSIKKTYLVRVLLQNSLAEDEKPVIYSLEAEFAKTKKNRDFKPLLVFWGFVLILMGSTLGTVRFLERQSRQVNIDISDFEDLRLKEALSEAEELRGAYADLERYQYALKTSLKDKKADGYVIDPRQEI